MKINEAYIPLSSRNNGKIQAFSDADWGSDIDKNSKRQTTVAVSSTEAEYIALSTTTKEVLWLKQLIRKIDQKMAKTVTIFCDNQSAICISKNDALLQRSKHIAIQYHHEKENDEIIVNYMPTEEMPADLLAKGIPKGKFLPCISKMGLKIFYFFSIFIFLTN